ncbi:MAG: hypothetical protein BWX68_02404 [Verrucomicrobia bacterium ADurb.Bin063]|nr:MAG: hypothetical protein BWX68_02404 [Verrucomicrobia bacterium ADurb.Bin063]
MVGPGMNLSTLFRAAAGVFERSAVELGFDRAAHYWHARD